MPPSVSLVLLFSATRSHNAGPRRKARPGWGRADPPEAEGCGLLASRPDQVAAPPGGAGPC